MKNKDGIKQTAKNKTVYFSVAIVTRNRSKLLEQCLLSLSRQTVYPGELLVIDNGSDDETREVALSFAKILPIRYLYESKIGIPYARNRALKESKGEILAFIDDDCEAAPTWIEEMIKAHEKYPQAAAIQGKLSVMDAKSIFSILSERYYNSWFRKCLMPGNRIITLDTANTSFKKKELIKLAISFDVSFSRFYCGEDTDIAYQLLAKGQEIIYSPSALVLFRVRDTLSAFLARGFRVGAANKALSYKWYSFISIFQYGKISIPLISSGPIFPWSKRALIAMIDVLSLGTRRFGQTIEEIRIFYAQSLYGGISSNERKNQVLQFAIHVINKSRSHSPSLLLKILSEQGLYLLIISFFLKAKEQQSLKTLILERKNRFPEKIASSISVAIITRNRSSLLYDCLLSLSRQTVYPGELLVIDNGSDDETREVALSFAKILPIRYLYESKIGIPYARNRALKEAKGEILAFIDDDCEADMAWIQNMQEAHLRFPDATAIQGKAWSKPRSSLLALVWEYPYNKWLAKNTIHQNHLLVLDTKNVSFKLAIIRKLKLSFNTAFDRGSDVDFAKQLIIKSQYIMFNSSIIVSHWERSNIFSLFKQKYVSGRTMARIDYVWPSHLFSQQKIAWRFYNPNISFYRRWMIGVIFFFSENIFKLGYYFTKNKLFNALECPSDLSHVIAEKVADISVAIVTWNNDILLKQCLMSLAKQTMLPKELIIVLRPSNDNTVTVINSFSKILPIRIVIEKQPGVAQARNRALLEAKTDIVAFIDDDCEATSTWIEEMVNGHKKYPNALVIQGESSVLNRRSIFGILAHKYKNDWTGKNIIGENYLKIFDTQNSSLKINIIRNLGVSFDNSISQRFRYGDDADFSAQLDKCKQKKVYWPKAKIFFRSKTTLFSFLKQRFLIGRTNRFLACKWPDLYQYQSKIIDPAKNLLPVRRYLRPLHFLVNRLSGLAYRFGVQVEAVSLYKRNFSRLYESSSLPYVDKRQTRLSVMVITKDRLQLLKRCLQSLANQKLIPDEVIIVDSSKKRAYSFIRQFKEYLPIKYVYEKRIGFGVARNTALKYVTGQIVATIDDDEEAAPDWSEQIIAAHRKFSNAAAIQGRFICKPTSLYAITEQIRLDRWFLNSLRSDNTIWALSTKNVSFKVNVLKHYRLKFTEDPLYATLGDDVDFGNRILSKNLPIVYEPSIVVYHNERASFSDYLKQQYRKGEARALIKHDWKELEYKKSFYYFPYRLSHIIDVFTHPLGKKKILFTPFLLFTYLLSTYFYNKGSRSFNLFLRSKPWLRSQSETENTSLKQKTAPITVAIITRNRAGSLYRALRSLTQQTLSPSKVLIIDNASSDNTREAVNSYKKFLPISYVYEAKVGIPFARNRALCEAKNRILTFMDDDCEADPLWVEKIVEGHKKYPKITAILGGVVNMPRDNIFAIVVRFNYQTWIRDHLIGDRNLYWDMIYGKTEKFLEILVCDTKNLSLKMNHIRKFNIKFNDKLRRGSDSEFGREILSSDLHILFYPKALIYHHERDNLKDYLQQAFCQGESLGRKWVQWPTEYQSLRRRTTSRLAAFTYFCLVNKYYLKLPILIILFLIHRRSRQKGESFGKMDHKVLRISL